MSYRWEKCHSEALRFCGFGGYIDEKEGMESSRTTKMARKLELGKKNQLIKPRSKIFHAGKLNWGFK